MIFLDMLESKIVKEDIRLHKKEVEEYGENNPEIFNNKEKERIKSILDRAIDRMDTGSP